MFVASQSVSTLGMGCYEAVATHTGGAHAFVEWGLRPVPYARHENALVVSFVQPLDVTESQLRLYTEFLGKCGAALAFRSDGASDAPLTRLVPQLTTFIDRLKAIVSGVHAREGAVSMAGYCLRMDGSLGGIGNDIAEGSPTTFLQPPYIFEKTWGKYQSTWLQDSQGMLALQLLVEENYALAAFYATLRIIHELNVPLLWGYALSTGFLPREGPHVEELREAHKKNCLEFAFNSLPLRLSDFLPFTHGNWYTWHSQVRSKPVIIPPPPFCFFYDSHF
jgi:hypothetical protein